VSSPPLDHGSIAVVTSPGRVPIHVLFSASP
jgi:hypothetical protein